MAEPRCRGFRTTRRSRHREDFDPLPEQPSPDATEDLGGPSNDLASLPDGSPNPSVAGELTPVPDPSALSLFAIGLVVIALIARRRRIEI